ncbi:hypothetical protein ACFQ2N_00120 [Pseudoxanthomonas kaohsiungensis]|uniref:HNH endonuclease n=2 Tax=Pseudoxanthomonas kaohsiungensis TaxID=283923 RepID=A0ABW3LSH1_9GAMM
MTPACPTLTLADFQNAIDSLDVPHSATLPLYARRRVLEAAGEHCPLCRQPYIRDVPRSFSAPVIATCVHPFLGGPLTIENAFVCCRRCQQSRASSDLLTVAELPECLREQRARTLLLSHNHLVPLPSSVSLPAYREALRARHAMPRSRVYAAQADDGICMLGVSSRYGDRLSKGLANLLAGMAGKPLAREKRRVVYLLTDDNFRRVVWQMIDANARVVGVGRRTELRDFLDHWWLTSASVSELRRGKAGGASAPPPVLKARPVKPSTERMRRLAARRKAAQERAEAEREYEEANAAMEAMLSARRQRKAFPTDPEMEAEVLARYGQASRRLNAALGYSPAGIR